MNASNNRRFIKPWLMIPIAAVIALGVAAAVIIPMLMSNHPLNNENLTACDASGTGKIDSSDYAKISNLPEAGTPFFTYSKNLFCYADDKNLYVKEINTGKQLRDIPLPEEILKDREHCSLLALVDNYLYFEISDKMEFSFLHQSTLYRLDLDSKQCEELHKDVTRSGFTVLNHRCFYADESSLLCYDCEKRVEYDIDDTLYRMKGIEGEREHSDGKSVTYWVDGDTVFFRYSNSTSANDYDPELSKKVFSAKYDGSDKTLAYTD